MVPVAATALSASLQPRIADARAHAGDAGAPKATEVVAATFKELLDIPTDWKLQSVNGRPVASAAQALENVQRSLSSGTVVALRLTSPSGLQRVYLTPSAGAPVSPGG